MDRLMSLLFTFSEIECQKPDTKPELLYKVRSFKVGGIVDYQCVKGYLLKGNSTQTCIKKGTWSGTLPSCRGKSKATQAVRVLFLRFVTWSGLVCASVWEWVGYYVIYLLLRK